MVGKSFFGVRSFNIIHSLSGLVGGACTPFPHGEPRHCPPFPQLSRQRILSRPWHHFTNRIFAASTSSMPSQQSEISVTVGSGRKNGRSQRMTTAQALEVGNHSPARELCPAFRPFNATICLTAHIDSQSICAPPLSSLHVSCPSGHMQLFACVAGIRYPCSPAARAFAALATCSRKRKVNSLSDYSSRREQEQHGPRSSAAHHAPRCLGHPGRLPYRSRAPQMR